MTRIHSECFKYARENDYVLVRYAQGDWQTRDAELILYLEVPGKPPLVGIGLTERAVHCLRNIDRETRDVTSTISRAGEMMRVATGRDDIPCSAFVPVGDAPELRAYLRWVESVTYPAVPQTLVDFKGGLLPTARRSLLPNDSHREDNEGNRCNSSVAKILPLLLGPSARW